MYILGVHQLVDWPSLVYSPQHCEIRGVLSASHAHILQLCLFKLRQTRQKTLDFGCCFGPVSHDSSEPVSLTSAVVVALGSNSKLVDNRPSTQEGKQTSQEATSSSTSKRPS